MQATQHAAFHARDSPNSVVSLAGP